MSVRRATGQKANGKWVDRWREGGVQCQRTFDLKGDRDDFRIWRRRQQQLGAPVAAQLQRQVTLGEFVEEWWARYALVELGAQTRAVYAQTWTKHLLPRLGRHELRAITPDVVLDLRERLSRKKVGDPTIVKALTVLQSVLSFAELTGRVDNNAAAKVRKPSQTPDRQVPPIRPAVVEQMRRRLGPRDAMLVSVLAYAGLRPQEALALEWDDVLDRALFIHRKTVDGEVLPYTKTRRHRSVRLLAPLAKDLREYRLASGGRRGLLFPRPDGDPWRTHDWKNWHRRVYRPVATAVGLEAGRPYDLRGSFVSLLIWEGQTIVEVSRQAGHSVATSDRHYARMFEDFDPDARTSAETAIWAARRDDQGRLAL